MKIRYYTFNYPGSFDQHIQETWSAKMKLKHPDKINNENWIILHLVTETNQFGEKL